MITMDLFEGEDRDRIRDAVTKAAVIKARAEYPAAASDIEALAKHMMDAQAKDEKELEQAQEINIRQDELLQQIRALDSRQDREIDSVESEENDLEQKIKMLRAANEKLTQTVANMRNRKKNTEVESSDLAESGPETWTVHFTDGTTTRIRVPNDETDPAKVRAFFAKKGKTVTKFDYGFGTEPTADSGPEAHEPGSGTAVSARTGERLPETQTVAEGEDKVRLVNDAEYYHLKTLAKDAGITLTGMGADKTTGDLYWQGNTRDGRRVEGTVKKVIDDGGEYIQGVAEADDRYELKITDQWEDEDPESYGMMDEYKFDVLKNGRRIGTARANNYFADLYVDLDNGKHLKLTHQKHESHPLMKEYERLVWGLDESDETSWTANSAQFRKEEDMTWTFKITIEPNADENKGRGRREVTKLVSAQSMDAAKKKIREYYLRNGWEVVGIEQVMPEMDTYPHPDSKEGKKLTKAIRDPNAPEVKSQPVKKTVKHATKILDKEFHKSFKEAVPTPNRGGHNPLRDPADYQDKRAHLFDLLSNAGMAAEDKQFIRQRLLDLDTAARKQGFVK